ncbi:glycerate kinase [Apis cerana cerana]|uniref:Glycerate kinase n=1 Tax=Apis cerana cerana TaxID=94128 RepID=A0A2A3E6C7_APICC|nr:glycerate kinase [Apis cerana cerana]
MRKQDKHSMWSNDAKKKPRKRKPRIDDPYAEEQRQIKIKALKEKRQKIIDEVKLSLESRRKDKIILQNAFFDKESKLRRKALRDSKKEGSEKIMLEVLNFLE